MTILTEPNAETSATINIIGGGFSGTTVAIEQIKAYLDIYRDAPDTTPALTVRVFNKSPLFGPGLPYNDQAALLLNQPSYAMSPFEDDPEHFTRWRIAKGIANPDINKSRNDFETRDIFGRYLQDIFAQACQSAARASAPITLECIQADITTLDVSQAGRSIVTTADGQSYNGNALVIADGHQTSDFLSAYSDDPDFFQSPYNPGAIKDRLSGKTDAVGIVGTSQSMLDVLAILDHIGYAGDIYAFSRDQVLPWAFHPEKYDGPEARPTYVPVILTAKQFEDTKPSSALLIKALHDEIEAAAYDDFDIGHVITSPLLKQEVETLSQKPEWADACRILRKQIAKIYGNPTSPQRHDLFRRYLDSGQLKLVQSAVKEDQIERLDAGYALHGLDNREGGTLAVAALFNAACYTRNPLASPLLSQAFAQNALNWDEDNKRIKRPGQQANPALYVVGPPVHTEKWGVETFRSHCKATAKDSLQNVLNGQQTGGLGRRLQVA